MNKFWNWMAQRGYDCISAGSVDGVEFSLYKEQFEGKDSEIEIDCCGNVLDNPLPRQMLIGYMLEFLLTFYDKLPACLLSYERDGAAGLYEIAEELINRNEKEGKKGLKCKD